MTMDDETVRHMQERVERCYRLAKQTTDERTAKALLEIAAEGEADLARMMAERGPQIPVIRI
jgi:hypothetical protein